MTDPSSSEAAPSPPGKAELLAAFDHLVASEKAKAVAAAAPPPRPRPAVWKWVIMAASWLILGYLWIGRPAWLFEPPPAPTVGNAEAGLRFAMYLEHQRVMSFLAEHGRVPGSLEEAGDVEDGIMYLRLGDSAFVLEAAIGQRRLTLKSTDRLPEFLGDALERWGVEGRTE